LSKVLWAARRSAYGGRVRGSTQLETWPLLAQQQVRADPRAFYCGPRWLAVPAHTGGTSGAPLMLLRSPREIALEQAFIDFVTHEATGLPADARCAVLHTEEIKDPNDFHPPYWIFAAGGRRLVCSADHLNAATIGAYAQVLREFRPLVLFAYPTSLEVLCQLLGRTGEQVRIPHVACSSEMLHPHVWALARETLGCTVLDRYGQAERVARACATQPGQYRFVPGYAHVELLQVDAREDRKVYEIVGTSLWNPAMTLVRYRTGDLIHLPAEWGRSELEEVTLGVRPFDGVTGRDSDILLTPEGVKLTGLSHFHRDVPHIARVQIIQEQLDSVRLLVQQLPGYSQRDTDRLLHNIRLKVPASMAVAIQCVDELERTAVGKTPFVIHRPVVKQLLAAARAEPATA
jgi:phenylacetate-coenzyme A ligase PaaK-like adenylate-forming protein